VSGYTGLGFFFSFLFQSFSKEEFFSFSSVSGIWSRSNFRREFTGGGDIFSFSITIYVSPFQGSSRQFGSPAMRGLLGSFPRVRRSIFSCTFFPEQSPPGSGNFSDGFVLFQRRGASSLCLTQWRPFPFFRFLHFEASAPAKRFRWW